MIDNITNLPNYYNGKVYKRWDNVNDWFGRDISATKISKNGEKKLLYIKDGGKSKELYSDNGKITDITDKDNIKRTYVHQKLADGSIKGTMYVNSSFSDVEPLIMQAEWITKDLMPQKLKMKINPNHPKSKIFIHSQKMPDGTPYLFGLGRYVKADEVEASDFNGLDFPLPCKIVIKKSSGDVETIYSENPANNIIYAQNLNITGKEIAKHLQTVV